MTKPVIRLSPSEDPAPKQAHIPDDQLRRWWAGIEDVNRPARNSVIVTQEAYAQINEHAESDMKNEVGGWLIGRWRVDSATEQEFITVEAILPAVHVRHGSAYLTFTQESQIAMYDLMEENFPGKDLVGWFHTHPRMGVFLSHYDVFLHSNFFPKPWQVALVLEPHSSEAGFFIRDTEGELDPRHYYGFHEFGSGQEPSVVKWGNMLREPQTTIKEDE